MTETKKLPNFGVLFPHLAVKDKVSRKNVIYQNNPGAALNVGKFTLVPKYGQLNEQKRPFLLVDKMSNSKPVLLEEKCLFLMIHFSGFYN